jgi:hypothetical protein
MLGFNGGLMGVRRVPIQQSTSGVWTLDEQILAQKGFDWPLTGAVLISAITYSQSSIYSGTTAATNGPMTDGLQTGTETATGSSTGEWIKMDLGATYSVDRVVIGNASNSAPPGGWGSSYTSNMDLQYSLDDSNWTTIVNTGDRSPFNFLYTISFSAVSARYIRLVNTSSTWIALTEFYALSPDQKYEP